MAIITLLTDFGRRDHYVAALKARLLKDSPQATLVDISHEVGNGHIGEAGFLLRAVYNDFPKGTIHLVAVGAASTPRMQLLAAYMDGHYYVGPNNGILSLIDANGPDVVYLLPALTEDVATFPSKYMLAPIAAALANGTPLAEVGIPSGEYVQKRFSPLRTSANALQGEVIHVDHYGNLVTDIDWAQFQAIGKGRSYTVKCGYERFSNINTYYGEKDYGDCVLLFNSLGLLEIAIHQGNASELLGLGQKSPILVQFIQE